MSLLPDLWLPFARRIQTLINRGEIERAHRLASKYARIRPGDPQAWFLLAWTNQKCRGTRSEIEILRQGLRIHSNSLELAIELARSLRRLAEEERNRSHLDEANQLLEKLIESHPHSASPFQGLADGAFLERDYEKALVHAKEAYKRLSMPRDFDTLISIAVTAMLIPNQREWAKKLLREAIEERPKGDSRPHAFLALLLEDEDPASANNHLSNARRWWKSKDFESDIELQRQLLKRGTEDSQQVPS